MIIVLKPSSTIFRKSASIFLSVILSHAFKGFPEPKYVIAFMGSLAEMHDKKEE